MRVYRLRNLPGFYLVDRPPGLYLVDLRLPEKPRYVELPREELARAAGKIRRAASVQAKLDGVLTFVAILDDGVHVLAHRPGPSGRPVEYDIPGLRPSRRPPASLRGRILAGEFLLERNGRPLPAEQASGYLHTRRRERYRGARPRIHLFDVLSDDESWSRRRRKLEASYRWLVRHYPELFALSEHHDPEDALALFEAIARGEHPLTSEGVVLHRRGRPGGWKVKTHEDTHVYIRGFEPVRPGARYRRGVGAIYYSLTPDGPIVGKIGSGIPDRLREELAENPEYYLGRRARIRHSGRYTSGAYRHPRLIMIE